MTDVSSVSRDQLQSRRQVLRRQRRRHIGQSLWRFLALSGLTAIVFWGFTRPIWLLQSPRQIQVTGNHWLSTTTVQELIPLDYPQSLFQVEPEVIANQLRQRAPLVSAEVTRQFLPPRLKVKVQERVPVAVVLSPGDSDRPGETQFLPTGLIDAQGAWMPKSSFGLSEASAQLPTLRLRGLQPQYQRYWPQVYETIRTSPVEIREIDWHDPSNLVLHTDLGVVYLGAYTPDLEQQLATLDRMRNLPEQLGGSQVAHIDLSNPASPSVAIVGADSDPAAPEDATAPSP
ncbi:MAG TPA: FtsQ-type POTRA domain-containing protein [Leptolyngbyaceae cyanobacterium M65_K2018_010]|nr:FtsQ-type POTRA domain-containing protein [Leptolyngbyaceae cyanobacterium M65_K2018_010]